MIPISKRKVAICILLSIVTLGVYKIYWQYLLVKNIRSIQKNEKSCTGEMLCLIFVPLYSVYWWFTRGKVVKNTFAEHGYTVVGDEIAYLILSALGCDIVGMVIMQNDFNALRSEANPPNRPVEPMYNFDPETQASELAREVEE